MRKVNIQSGKQPWVSHHRGDLKAFNRNTHSLSLINKVRFSVCADLNSAFLSLGKRASHSRWETTGSLGRWVEFFFLVLAVGSTFALQRATFSSLFGLRANRMDGHSHSCTSEDVSPEIQIDLPKTTQQIHTEPGHPLLSSFRAL